MTHLHRALVPAALLGALLAGPVAAQNAGGLWTSQIPSGQQSPRNTLPSPTTEQILQSFSMPSPDIGSSGVAVPGVSANAAGQAGNQAVLSQYGSGNTGTITQTGAGNLASASVNGIGNVTTQTQLGAGNASTLILGPVAGVQDNRVTTYQENTSAGGPGNSAAYTITGNGITLNSSQIGSNLSYSATFSAAPTGSDKTITIQQLGTGMGLATVQPGLPASNAAVISTTRAK